MTRISKDQAEMLLNKGFKWHKDVMKTSGRYITYYACEKPEILELINKTAKE